MLLRCSLLVLSFAWIRLDPVIDTKSTDNAAELLRLNDRRDGNTPCPTGRTAKILPTIPLAKRNVYLEKVASSSVGALNAEICDELSTIELHNISPHVPPSVGALNVSFWNMERGGKWKDAVSYLQHSQIILLNEADSGMARSGNVNVVRELASALGKNYVLGIEFVELTNGLPAEIAATAGLANSQGYHCNAIISDFPLEKPSLTRLPFAKDWFRNPGGTEKRLGSRMLLSSKIRVWGQSISLVVTHLDAESVELENALVALTGPMIFAGDLGPGGNIDHSSSRLAKAELTFEVNRESSQISTHGYVTMDGTCQVPGFSHDHLFGLRTLTGSNVTVETPSGPTGECLADSPFLYLSITKSL
eukprot:GEMP01032421.1.p1 GENE.GEMP01032421.1~~GEMP01032421.1.p1  ORF type:complete len:362 (+),score=58.61 GEMP01032421.1:238-1323(+)